MKGAQRYCLDHLHPFMEVVELPAFKGHPARTVQLHVGFASHVFTRSFQPHDDPAECYRDERESRAFDEKRYGESHALPEIVRLLCLGQVKCYFGKNNNFLVIRPASEPEYEYRVFFDLERWEKEGPDAVLLVVQSAYADRIGRAPKGIRQKPVGSELC